MRIIIVAIVGLLLPNLAWGQAKPMSLSIEGVSSRAFVEGAALFHENVSDTAESTAPVDDVSDLDSLHRSVKGENLRPTTLREVSGYKGGKIWVLFSLRNETKRSAFVVRYRYPSMQNISLLQFAEDGRLLAKLKSGKLVPAAERPIPDGEFLFPIQILPGKAASFAAILESNGSIQLPFEILTSEAMHEVTKTKHLLFGFYYGVTALILLYSIFLTVTLRKRIYLTYVFYVLSVIFAQMGLHGIAYQYIWPAWHEWNKVSTIFFVGLMFVTLSAFTISSLRLKDISRFFYGVILAFAIVSGLISLSALFFYGNTVIRCTGILTSILPLIILPAGLVAWRKRETFAPFYVSAVAFYLLGASFYGLKDSGILPANFLTENGILFGSLVEIAVLSLGIAYQIRSMNREATLLKFNYDKASALSEIASQISHDIRSPLSALNMAVSFLKDIPEEQRLLVRGAAQRINDIANELLQQSKKNLIESGESADRSVPNQDDAQPAEPVMLIALLDAIVSEKRTQFRERIGVEICTDLGQGYGLFAEINAAEFSRSVSNCINNSVEAIGDSGRVTIAIRRDRDSAHVIISDTGSGIPAEILVRLGELGVTHGKSGTQSGSGRGVYYTRKIVESAGGQLRIQSREGEGTMVTIILPCVPAPGWFVDRIRLAPNSLVVSVDDDSLIHSIWGDRLKRIEADTFGIRHKTFSSLIVFEDWVKIERPMNVFFFVDFEFLRHGKNGLRVIRELGIVKSSILVTSRFEESRVQMDANEIGLKILPKGLAALVPVEVARESQNVVDQRTVDHANT